MVETENENETKAWDQLTARQRELIGGICWLHHNLGRHPSFREIQDAFGFSGPNAVWCHFKYLCRYGWVEKCAGVGARRSWRVKTAPPAWVRLPGGGIAPRENLKELVRELQKTLRGELCQP